MNEITLLRDAGPEAPALDTAARHRARAALLTEIERSTTVGGRLRSRLPRRRTAVGIGAGVTVAAVAWTAAVVIAAPDTLGPPPGSVRLVAFDQPTFPFSLDPVPAGLTPSFSADPGGIRIASYRGPEGDAGLTVIVSPEQREQYDVTTTEDVTVGSREAELVSGTETWCEGPGPDCVEVERPYVHLVLEWRDSQWVQLSGEGRYDDADQLVAVAESLVDHPQPVPLQVHLAPAGWSVQAYKDDRILTLVNDSYEQQTVNIHLPEQPIPAEELLGQLMGPVGPVIEVTVHGRPAQLVRIDGDMDGGWYLQAQFPDGTTVVVQAPQAFTQQQVVEMAEQVTYNP
jgi:hypothetical protein